MKNKSLASLDIKSVYTNIPAAKCIKLLQNHLQKTNIVTPTHCGGMSISLRCNSECQFHNILHNLYKQCRQKKIDKNKNVKKQTIFYFITTGQIIKIQR